MPAARQGTAAYSRANDETVSVGGKVRVVRNYARSVRMYLSDCLRAREPWETAWARCQHEIRPWQPDWHKEQDGASPFEVCERAMETEYKERLLTLALDGGIDYADLMESV